MIEFGGPLVCARCRTLMHPPRDDCPDPYVCLSGDDCPACRAPRDGIPLATVLPATPDAGDATCTCGTLSDLGGPGTHHDEGCPLYRVTGDASTSPP